VLQQVRAGIAAGRTVDQLVNDIDLLKHKTWGTIKVSSDRSIRAMYKILTASNAR